MEINHTPTFIIIEPFRLYLISLMFCDIPVRILRTEPLYLKSLLHRLHLPELLTLW